MSDEVLDLPEFLERVQNDKELLIELLGIFVEDFQEKKKILIEAVANKDVDTVKSVAHSLKGATGNISAKAMRKTFVEIEQKAKDANMAGMEAMIPLLEQQFDALSQRISTLPNELN